MFTLEGLDNLENLVIFGEHLELQVHLFKNNHTVTKNTVIGDLTESTFTGYAAKADVAFGAVANNGSDEAASDGPEMTWTCTANITAQQAFGYYTTILDDSNTRVLLTAGNFASPVTIAFNGDLVKKKINWRLKNYTP